MFHFDYRTTGTCSQEIHLDLDGEVVRNVSFEGGCNGNLKAIAILTEGQTVDYIVEKLAGNICGMRTTSCADQLSRAVRAARIARDEE